MIKYRFFWTWDHSTNWCLTVSGRQNCGVANSYAKDPKVFVKDYKRAIDWCADHKMTAMGSVGFLRDAHGGVDSAREICAYAQERGVKMYIIAGLFSYGGIYYEGNSQWSLDQFFKKNPDCIGINAQGERMIWKQPSVKFGYNYITTGCPSDLKLNQYILDSLDWLFKTLPELGGIQMETGDVGICMCERCRERRMAAGMSENASESFNDMARIYAKAANVVWNRNPNALVICESYHHFLDEECQKFFNTETPSPELKDLLELPEKTCWQWKCDRRLASGEWKGESLPGCLKKFNHVMRAHSGTQWWGGRHTLAVDLIRKQCLLSYKSGLNGVSIFGEGAPYHTNVEFNYLALEYFADHPEAGLESFVSDVMAPRLGGLEQAAKYLEFGNLHDEPEKIPAAAVEIAHILHGMNDYEVIRRWEYLGSFLNAYYWESQQSGYEKRIESQNNNML